MPGVGGEPLGGGVASGALANGEVEGDGAVGTAAVGSYVGGGIGGGGIGDAVEPSIAIACGVGESGGGSEASIIDHLVDVHIVECTIIGGGRGRVELGEAESEIERTRRETCVLAEGVGDGYPAGAGSATQTDECVAVARVGNNTIVDAPIVAAAHLVFE